MWIKRSENALLRCTKILFKTDFRLFLLNTAEWEKQVECRTEFLSRTKKNTFSSQSVIMMVVVMIRIVYIAIPLNLNLKWFANGEKSIANDCLFIWNPTRLPYCWPSFLDYSAAQRLFCIYIKLPLPSLTIFTGPFFCFFLLNLKKKTKF